MQKQWSSKLRGNIESFTELCKALSMFCKFLCKTCLDNFCEVATVSKHQSVLYNCFSKDVLCVNLLNSFTVSLVHCLPVSQEIFDGDECPGTGSQSASVKLFFDSTRLKLIGFGVKHWKNGTHIGRVFFSSSKHD